MTDESYDNEAAWWADPSFNCPDCLRSSAANCDCGRGTASAPTKPKRITAWEAMEDREYEQDIIDRERDRAARAADREASMARAEAAARAKQAKLEVVDDDDDVEAGDGSYSIAEAKAGETLRQLRFDREAARRAHAPGADPDDDDC